MGVLIDFRTTATKRGPLSDYPGAPCTGLLLSEGSWKRGAMWRMRVPHNTVIFVLDAKAFGAISSPWQDVALEKYHPWETFLTVPVFVYGSRTGRSSPVWFGNGYRSCITALG